MNRSALAMARKYSRDNRGRFASGGGGGGGSKGKASGGGKKAAGATAKAPSTRAANDATEKRLLGKGLRAVGGRLAKKNAALFQGTAKTKAGRSGRFREAGDQLRTNGMRGQPAVDGAWNRGAVRGKVRVKGTMGKRRGK